MIVSQHRYLVNSNRQEQQKIYDHLLDCVRNQSPIEVLERFHHLFIKGTSYENIKIRRTLENIVDAKDAESNFPQFFNRCCHIIVNRWQMQPHFKIEIVELVYLLERALPPGGVVSRIAQKQRQLIKNFQNTEYYLKLQRLARLIDGSIEPEQRRTHRRIEIVSNSVGDLIQRYPYLHKHCLLTEASTEEFQQTVKTIQAGIQSSYELNLSQYVTHRVRLAQTIRQYRAANKTKIPKRLVKKVENPTLLSDRELDRALRHYTGKVERDASYYDLSQNFLTHTSQVKTYKNFKADLYEYIVSGLDSSGDRDFNKQLYNCLQDTLTDFEHRELDEFLTMRTYCQLFKFLVVDSKGNLNHERYLNLINHLGEVKTIGLLLKLVLLCRKVKPYLEQRFSLLFSHYETVSEDQAPWLVNSLENLQVAFSVHFGQADFSLIQII